MLRLISILLCTLFMGCAPKKTFRVGVTSGPHAQIMAKVKEVAQKKGLAIEMVEFNDFILPNQALVDGELDANSYQHAPFLVDQIKTRGFALSNVGKTVLMPLGLYSKKIARLSDLSTGATIAIPNDPTNEGRALLLLEQYNLLKLKKGAALPSLADIENNPLHLKILTVEAPQLPRSLDDTDGSVINTDWAFIAGLDPNDAIVREGQNSDYANIIVVRKGDEKRSEVKKFLAIYHSPAVKDFIELTFNGAVIPAW